MLSTLRTILKDGSPPAPRQYAFDPEEEAPPPTIEPAYKPAYPLYPYQQQSAHLLEQIYREGAALNVLCASATGSGKSFLIKNAASLAVQTGQKLIVGVPLVALAEQQFYDLTEAFQAKKTVDVLDDEESDCWGGDDYDYAAPSRQSIPTLGIWTGPTQVNEKDALVVICTYEIIKIQLDNNPAFFDGCPALILDEIHTIAEKERGSVLESILTHPQFRANVVGLSGTLENALEFAENLGRSNGRKTAVVGMKARPITLTTHLDIGNQVRRVAHGTEVDDVAWGKAMEDVHMALPRKLNFAQLKTRLVNLLYRLKTQEFLPALVLAFSCRKLNDMAEAVRAIDFLPEKKNKWRVRVLFARLRKRVPEEDWVMFQGLDTLARNGIVVHHSQCPKHYLETVSLLAQRGLARVVFCTSSLSTGINLPVKTVCLTGSRMPAGDGAERFIPSNLFWQICGRAGRPGYETEGHVVLCEWEQDAQWRAILQAAPTKVRGHGTVNVGTVLRSLTYASVDAEATLTNSPFSTASHEHLRPFLLDCEAELATYSTLIVAGARNWLKLRECRETAHRLVAHFLATKATRGTAVLVEGEFPRMHPHRWTFVRWASKPRTFVVEESPLEIEAAWVVDVDIPMQKKFIPLHDHLAIEALRASVALVLEGPVETTAAAFDLVEAADRFRARYFGGNPFCENYQHILARLQTLGYANGAVATAKGRMATQLVGCEDPVSLNECFFRKVIPTNDACIFAAALTCFLTTGQDGPYNAVHQTFRTVMDEVGLRDAESSSLYFGPVWSYCYRKMSIADIINTYKNVSVGHLCKTIQRVVQLIEQIAKAWDDEETRTVCDESLRLLKRGLPFVSSTFV